MASAATDGLSTRGTQATDNTHALILECAKDLFAEFGFDRVSTRDIAEKTGLKQASLYYYFESKQDLYDAVLAQSEDAVNQLLSDAVQAPGTPEERLRRFFRTAIIEFRSTTSAARIVDRELMEHGEEDGTHLVTEITRRPHEALAAVLRELAPNCPAEPYAFYFFCLAYGARKHHAIQLQLRGLEELREQEKLCDALADFALLTLRAHPSPLPPSGEHIRRIAELEDENKRLRDLVVSQLLGAPAKP